MSSNMKPLLRYQAQPNILCVITHSLWNMCEWDILFILIVVYIVCNPTYSLIMKESLTFYSKCVCVCVYSNYGTIPNVLKRKKLSPPLILGLLV